MKDNRVSESDGRESHARVACYCDTDLVHASYAVTGLIELADEKAIDLSFHLEDRTVGRYRGVWTLWLTIEVLGKQHRVCIDCHDVPTYFCPESLAACDRYYKSNLRRDTYEAVPSEHRAKLRPFGPYLPCRPRRDRSLALRRLGNLWAKFRHRFITGTKRRSLWDKWRAFAPELNRHKRYASRAMWDKYEAPPNEIADDHEPAILFNPSCWDESEGEEIRAMNESRAKLIVALRREFGERFIGGFRNFGPSTANYPEAVEPRAIPHAEYVRLLQATPVTVYVNGKWGCFSWRLPENFAAGKCMISEPIANDAGFPLDESAGIVQCESVEQMAAALRRVTSSPDEMRHLCERSREIYRAHLRPATRMRKLLSDLSKSHRSDHENDSLATAEPTKDRYGDRHPVEP